MMRKKKKKIKKKTNQEQQKQPDEKLQNCTEKKILRYNSSHIRNQ